jgi:predicted dehydrogenase
MSDFRVGVVGLGFPMTTGWSDYLWTGTGNGLDHVDAIRRLGNLSVEALCDIQEEPLREAAGRLSVSRFTTDYQELVARDDLDIVVVSTPNATHAEIAIAALDAGKHVVLEKPMCITLEDCGRMIDAVERSGRKLIIDHIQRFAPRYQETHRLARSGALGQLFYGEGANIRNMPGLVKHGWRGKAEHRHTPMIGMATHSIDLLRWIFDDEVAEVSGFSTPIAAGDWPAPFDVASAALLKFNGGAVARVFGAVLCAAPMIYQLQVWGTEGTIMDDGLYLKHDEDRRLDFSVHWDPDRPNDPMYKHFIGCIVADRRPLIDVYEGANTVAVALAAQQSIETGTSVVPEFFKRPAR